MIHSLPDSALMILKMNLDFKLSTLQYSWGKILNKVLRLEGAFNWGQGEQDHQAFPHLKHILYILKTNYPQ